MNQTPPEVITAILAFTAFWAVALVGILVAGNFIPVIAGFRTRMLAQWKPAVLITLIYYVSAGLGSNSWLNPYAIAIFCQAFIGLAIASTILGFEALPFAHAISGHKKIGLEIALLLGIALVAAVLSIVVGIVGMSIGRQIFGETSYTQQAQSVLFTSSKWRVFFALLGGAGIAEESTYRLVILSLVWKLSNRKWLAIVVSALVFGAYHLSPLNSMYQIFWKFPISQFMSSTLIGLLQGYVFTKRGFGTTALAHVLSDWLPFMLFSG